MKTKPILLSLLLFGLVSVAAPSTTLAQSVPTYITADAPYTYNHGYDMGNDAARNNRRSMSPQAYLYWYSDALSYAESQSMYGDPSEAQYWEGFYDGLQAGFRAGTGGGGTGPIEDVPFEW